MSGVRYHFDDHTDNLTQEIQAKLSQLENETFLEWNLSRACNELHQAAWREFKKLKQDIEKSNDAGRFLSLEKTGELQKLHISLDLVLEFLQVDTNKELNNEEEKKEKKAQLASSIHAQAQSLKKGPLKKLAGTLLMFVGAALMAMGIKTGLLTVPFGAITLAGGYKLLVDSDLAKAVAKLDNAINPKTPAAKKGGLFSGSTPANDPASSEIQLTSVPPAHGRKSGT